MCRLPSSHQAVESIENLLLPPENIADEELPPEYYYPLDDPQDLTYHIADFNDNLPFVEHIQDQHFYQFYYTSRGPGGEKVFCNFCFKREVQFHFDFRRPEDLCDWLYGNYDYTYDCFNVQTFAELKERLKVCTECDHLCEAKAHFLTTCDSCEETFEDESLYWQNYQDSNF